jgi:hypothetical protein
MLRLSTYELFLCWIIVVLVVLVVGETSVVGCSTKGTRKAAMATFAKSWRRE